MEENRFRETASSMITFSSFPPVCRPEGTPSPNFFPRGGPRRSAADCRGPRVLMRRCKPRTRALDRRRPGSTTGLCSIRCPGNYRNSKYRLGKEHDHQPRHHRRGGGDGQGGTSRPPPPSQKVKTKGNRKAGTKRSRAQYILTGSAIPFTTSVGVRSRGGSGSREPWLERSATLDG